MTAILVFSILMLVIGVVTEIDGLRRTRQATATFDRASEMFRRASEAFQRATKDRQ